MVTLSVKIMSDSVSRVIRMLTLVDENHTYLLQLNSGINVTLTKFDCIFCNICLIFLKTICGHMFSQYNAGFVTPVTFSAINTAFVKCLLRFI